MGKVQSFLWWCGGADRQILEKCSSEKSKYVGIGATVFFTGVFAALAGGYAVFTVFDSIYASLIFALLWGLMIFNLDRFIVSSMRKSGNRWSEISMSLPRIILAVLISIVIAKPLELKVFEKEIEAEILVMQQEEKARKETLVRERFQDESIRLKGEVENLQRQIKAKEEKRNELMRIAQQEADGTGGTQKRNAGPIYRLKKADADKVDTELDALKSRNQELIKSKLTQIDENNDAIKSELAAMEEASLTGLASRLEAMDRIASQSTAIAIANIFILLLFIAVETAPIFVKLITSRGPYDFLQGAEEHQYQADYYHDISRINSTTKRRSEDLLDSEKTYLNKKLDRALKKL